MGKLGAMLRLARIDHGVMAAIATLVGYALGAQGWSNMQLLPACIAVATTLSVEIGLFVFNDIYNLEEDRINAPWRPLVRGDIGVKEAWIIGLASLVLGTALSLSLGVMPALLVIVAVASGMAYNAKLKRAGLPGNIIVAFDTALPFLFGASIPSGFKIPRLAILLTSVAFLATLGREILKGILDMEGDRRVGVKTLAIVKGPAFAARVASLLMLAAVAASLLAIPLLPEEKLLLYASTVALTDALFTYVSFSLLLQKSAVAARSRKLTLLAMLTGILAFATTA
ncbi:MAG: UbiA family prenyltransferase [Thermofilaceae archaeon]